MFLVAAGLVLAEEDDSFPIRSGGFSDGGTLYIKDLRQNARTNVSMCWDQGLDSPTAGSFFLGASYPTKPGAKKASLAEVKAKLGEVKLLLENYFGAEVWAQILKIGNLYELDRLHEKYPYLNSANLREAYDACFFIRQVESLGVKAEPVGAGQPATSRRSKSVGKEKPKPNSEVRPR